MSISPEVRAAALEVVAKSGVSLEEVRMGMRERFIETGMSWAEADALILLHEALVEEGQDPQIQKRDAPADEIRQPGELSDGQRVLYLYDAGMVGIVQGKAPGTHGETAMYGVLWDGEVEISRWYTRSKLIKQKNEQEGTRA